jgi:hypothetical protein
MTAAGPKKGIFGQYRAKTGQAAGGRERSGWFSLGFLAIGCQRNQSML